MTDVLYFFDMDVFSWISWILAIGLCVYLYLMVRRGRRVPFEHPYCSECGFNLYGLPATSTNCPECGGELQRVRKTELWKRRWRGLLVTLVLVVACMLPVSGYVMRRVQGRLHGLDTVPAFALMWFRDKKLVQEALYRRMLEGGLSKSQEERFGETLIGQTQFAIYYAAELRKSGHLSDRLWKRAMETAAIPQVDSRGTIARGDPLVFRVWQYIPAKSPLKRRYRLHVKIDDQEITKDPSWLEGTEPDWQRLPYNFVTIPREMEEKLASGLHNITLIVDGEMTDPSAAPPLQVSKTATITSVIDLLPKGQSSVTLEKPTTLGNKSFSEKTTIYLNGDWPDISLVPMFPDFRTQAYSYRLIARQDGKEFPIGVVHMAMRERTWAPVTVAPPLHLGKCDVIFRVDPESAKRTVTMEKIVDHEVVVHDAAVEGKSNSN